MANFIERLKPETKIQVISSRVPRVGITSDALAKMFVYIDECSDEIGWLGTVEQVGDKYFHITDVFLFEQDVHGTTTEITPEGLSSFGEELLAQPDGIEIWNNLKMWGHSHVNMGVTPSGQDDKQMKEFADIGHDWFIRLIANKKGELKLDFFHYEMGVTFLDVPWEEVASEEEETIQDQIYQLQLMLEHSRDRRVKHHLEPIKEEMKDKVRKKTYGVSTGNRWANNNNNYANSYGRYVNGAWQMWEKNPPTEEEKKTHSNVIPKSLLGTITMTTNHITGDGKKKEETEEAKGAGRYLDEDVFDTDEDVFDMFSTLELTSFSYCETIGDMEAEVESMGYYNFFTYDDLGRILKVAHRTSSPYGDTYI